MDPNQKIYTATASAIGGRAGHIKSLDGLLDMDMRVPVEMGGPGGHGTNPEQLFAAGYAACFGGSIQAVAKREYDQITNSTVTAHVSMLQGFSIAVELEVHLEGIELELAEQIVHRAHIVCPYSKATRGNVEVNIKVV
jgi:lipoyl-dependent peroxiredoxin